MKARRRWTGCPRSRSAGSRSPRLRRRHSGAIIASTSSIRPGTWTSRSRSSEASACSTVRSSSSTASPVSSRSPRRSGARPTATACRASASSTSSTGPAPTSGRGVASIKERLGANAVPIQIPIGREDKFEGVVDLVEMKAYYYRDDLGTTFDVVDIPDDLRAEAEKHRHTMIEAVAEMDDELTHKYLEGEELTIPEIKRGLRLGTLTTRIIPVLTGSALRNKGVQKMLDAVVDYLPSPLDVPPMIAIDPRTGGEVVRDAGRQGAVQRPGLQDRGRPVRRQARVLPGLLGHAQGRLVRPEPDEGQARADRAHPPDAREPPRGDRRGLRRRHRRRGRPEGHLHRRHPDRPGPPGHPRVDDVPGAGHRGQDRAEDEGRPGQARRSPSSACPRRTRPSGSTPTRSRRRR